MPGIVRINDSITPEPCYGSYTVNSGSSNVFVNGIGVSRLNDTSTVHCCPATGDCHSTTIAQGSSTVFVNGLPVARINDVMADTGTIAQGSSDVFAN